ncbi:unnamed protein product [Closterium sp. NIES-64]|nr:unnamed protein product [Closterium sp. NIES-64]
MLRPGFAAASAAGAAWASDPAEADGTAARGGALEDAGTYDVARNEKWVSEEKARLLTVQGGNVPGGLLLTRGSWQWEERGPSLYRLVGHMSFHNMRRKQDIFLPHVTARVAVLLSSHSIQGISTHVSIAPRHPEGAPVPRADGYWPAYIVRAGKGTAMEVTVEIRAADSEDAADLSHLKVLSTHACHLPPVISRLSSPACHLPPVISRLSSPACHLPPVISRLSSPACHLPPVISRLSSPACHLPPVISRLSSPACHLPPTIPRPPFPAHHSPPTIPRPPFPAHHSPPTIPRPPFPAHHSPPTIPRPPFPAHHSPPTIPRPPFPAHHSPPTIPRPPFPAHHSPPHHSPPTIPRPPFPAHHSPPTISLSSRSAHQAARLDVHYPAYGPHGSLPLVQHVILPLAFPPCPPPSAPHAPTWRRYVLAPTRPLPCSSPPLLPSALPPAPHLHNCLLPLPAPIRSPRPSVAQVCPSVAQVCPSVAQVCPSVAQVCPSMAQVCPSVAQVCFRPYSPSPMKVCPSLCSRPCSPSPLLPSFPAPLLPSAFTSAPIRVHLCSHPRSPLLHSTPSESPPNHPSPTQQHSSGHISAGRPNAPAVPPRRPAPRAAPVRLAPCPHATLCLLSLTPMPLVQFDPSVCDASLLRSQLTTSHFLTSFTTILHRTAPLSIPSHPAHASYAAPYLQPGDVVTLGETPLAIMQGGFRHPDSVPPGLLARFACLCFLPASSLATACGMQVRVGVVVAVPRKLDCVSADRPGGGGAGGSGGDSGNTGAAAAGEEGRVLPAAGYQARLIDDITCTLPPYDQFITLGPLSVHETVKGLSAKLGCAVAVVDVNDLKKVKILAVTAGVDHGRLTTALAAQPSR